MQITFKIRELRKSKKLTLTVLSNLCNVSISQLSEIEKNNSDPKLSTVISIARALDVTLEELYTYYI